MFVYSTIFVFFFFRFAFNTITLESLSICKSDDDVSFRHSVSLTRAKYLTLYYNSVCLYLVE